MVGIKLERRILDTRRPFVGADRRQLKPSPPIVKPEYRNMVTKTTLEDLNFAEMYLEHVAKQRNPETRARARILLATIAMLDAKHPTWRVELLAEMAARGIERNVEDIFPLPKIDDETMFKDFMTNVLSERHK